MKKLLEGTILTLGFINLVIRNNDLPEKMEKFILLTKATALCPSERGESTEAHHELLLLFMSLFLEIYSNVCF